LYDLITPDNRVIQQGYKNMKFVFYFRMNSESAATPVLGIVNGDYVIDVRRCFDLRTDVLQPSAQLHWLHYDRYVVEGETLVTEPIMPEMVDNEKIFRLADVQIAPPPSNVVSLRDFYCFEEHVRNARLTRGLDMMPEWYDQPVFYYSNTHAICGPNAVVDYPKRTRMLDFELEIAAIIGERGRDIPVERAERYIAGYTIMNDWSARDVQRKEMAVGLGPAKGKDFATSLGPLLVTPDELEDRREGKGYDLEMIVRRNGKEITRNNWKTITFSFSEMISRASEDCMLYAGDVIGSGTVGLGCILELGADNVGGWLQPGDVIELEVERLGVLRNTIGAPRVGTGMLAYPGDAAQPWGS
jgi:fumarylacetoacetate (FAA) hydrolase